MSAAVALARLMRALPKESISQGTFDEYIADLHDIAPDLLDDGVTLLLRSRRDPWFPTIGDIRHACAEIYLALPTEHEAMTQVEARMLWGRGDRDEQAPGVHALVLRALSQVGGWTVLRESEDPASTRARFARVYRDLRAETIKETAVGLVPRMALTE